MSHRLFAAFIIALLLMAILPVTEQEPIAPCPCYARCNAIWVACYAAAGATAGTVLLSDASPLALLACNAAQGTCLAACTFTLR